MRDPLLGALIGNYRVLDVLGEGGMGRVYRARHPEIERLVAIKVLALGLAQSEDVVRRFRIEARAVNKIRHPNIVDVLDFGRLPDGRPYYVMELLAGESLHAYLKRAAPLAAGDTLRILLPVVDALAAAHAAGVVHRDLKPENVFLLADGRGGPVAPKLLDFGIAKVVGEVAGDHAQVTQSGALMGTPLYMAPEQAAGRVGEVGPASDVYSLGVMAYQMLAGRTPFTAGSLGELLLAHMQQAAPALDGVRPGLPPELVALVMQMLAKDPGARPASAADVRARLGELARRLGADAAAPLTVAPVAPAAAVEGIEQAATVAPDARPAASTSPSGLAAEIGARVSTMTTPRRGRAAWAAGGALVAAGVLVAIVVTRGPGAAPASGHAGAADAAAPRLVDESLAAAPPDAAPAAAVDTARSDAGPASELEQRLEALQRLHADGLITDAEYQRRRQAILQEL